jgi:hypothetical protein
VDFGIIVDSAVILVENIFRNFQKSRERIIALRAMTRGPHGMGDRPGPGLDAAPAHDLHELAAGRQLGAVLHRHHDCRLRRCSS